MIPDVEDYGRQTEARKAVIRRGRRRLLEVALAKGEVHADDIRGHVEIPRGVHPNVLGALPGKLAIAGIIESGGFVRSAAPQRHASYSQRWVLKDATAARNWLASNPELEL